MAKKKNKTVNQRFRDSRGRFTSLENLQNEIDKNFGLDIEFYQGFLKQYYSFGSSKNESANKYVFRKLKETSEELDKIEIFDFEDKHLIRNIKNSSADIYINGKLTNKNDAVNFILNYMQSIKSSLAYFYIRTEISRKKISIKLSNEIKKDINSEIKKFGEAHGQFSDKNGNYCLVSTSAKNVNQKK